MIGDLSIQNIGLSALVSAAAGYLGTLINYSRLRNRHRRLFGLSLLAEIKSLERLSRRYWQALAQETQTHAWPDLARLHPPSVETSVFNSSASNLGLLSTRTAEEIIEFYGLIRTVAAQAQRLVAQPRANDIDARLGGLLEHHLQTMQLASHHSEAVVAALEEEIPRSGAEMTRCAVRRLAVHLPYARRWQA